MEFAVKAAELNIKFIHGTLGAGETCGQPDSQADDHKQ